MFSEKTKEILRPPDRTNVASVIEYFCSEKDNIDVRTVLERVAGACNIPVAELIGLQV